MRWIYWAIGFYSIWSYQQGILNAAAILGLILYLAFSFLLIRLWPRTDLNTRRSITIILYAVDLLYASFIIYYTGGLVSQFYLLYCFWIFKAAIYYPYVHSIILVPFLILPLYVATLYLGTGTLVFMSDEVFVSRYALLFAVILGGLYTAWHLDNRHQQTRNLLAQLELEHRQIDEKRHELRAVLDSIGDGVIVVDRELRLLMINPVAADFFYRSYPQTPGISLNNFLDNPDLLMLLSQVLEQSSEADALVSGEIISPARGSGKTVVYQALATALVSEQDTPRGAVVVLRDMTRQRELEETKSNFISMLSHELRTPLTAIRGFVDLILSEDAGRITKVQREYLDIVSIQSEHLQQLINALLEFAEMEAAETSLELNLIALDELVKQAIDQVAWLAEQCSVTLQADVPSDLAPFFADGPRLERVLVNLLDNAVKFSPEQGLVTVTATDRKSDVLVCVSDTGCGVPPAEREAIFERFYQIDSSSTREHGGTGLGLALCKHIVEMHQGKIWVEQPDEHIGDNGGPGSRFCFTIPRDLA